MAHDPSQILRYDNLDDRREIHTLLGVLPPRARVLFLEWCCMKATVPNSRTHPKVEPKTYSLMRDACRGGDADRRLSFWIILDLVYLVLNHNFDLKVALQELTKRARAVRG